MREKKKSYVLSFELVVQEMPSGAQLQLCDTTLEVQAANTAWSPKWC